MFQCILKTTKRTEMLRLILCQLIISHLPLIGSFINIERWKKFSVKIIRTQNKMNKFKLEKLKST